MLVTSVMTRSGDLLYASMAMSGGWVVFCNLGDDVRVNFLHPHGPSPSFSYPHHPDILTVSVEDVLLCADPTTATGRVYTLSGIDRSTATERLKIKLQ